MFAQREAIIRLLRDEDARTVELVKDQLVAGGDAAISDLNDLLLVDDLEVTCHVYEILGQIDAKAAQAELSEFCREFPDHGGVDALEYAALLLARILSPGTEVEPIRRRFDEWGEQLAQRIEGLEYDDEIVSAVSDFFGKELNLHGDKEEYYHVRNSLLPEVVLSRVGIPLSLALIYMIVAERAGLVIEGVSFPGHFLVRLGDTLLDPFERGAVITPTEGAAILARQNLPMEPDYFEPAPPRAILRRMLANLLYLYRSSDAKVADTLEGWMHDLEANAIG